MRPCGTTAAYKRHYQHGESPCRPCVEAQAVYMAVYWRQGHPIPDTAARVIEDYVETHGPIEVTCLVETIRERKDIKDGTIRRAVWRMVNDGRLIASYDPVWPLTVEVP